MLFDISASLSRDVAVSEEDTFISSDADDSMGSSAMIEPGPMEIAAVEVNVAV